MKRFIGHVVIAVVLVTAAVASRRAAVLEDRLATAQEQLTTTGGTTQSIDSDLDDSMAFAARIPIVGLRIRREVRRQRAEAAYWRGDYASVGSVAAAPAGQENDPSLQLLATNAAYRTAVQNQRTNQALARSLDDVLKGYAAVLETAPDLADAAYNYEFVARLRNVLASGRSGTAPAPRTPNMQGEKGEPPEGTKKSDFNVIVPLRPEERQEQLDPGAGAEFKRKG